MNLRLLLFAFILILPGQTIMAQDFETTEIADRVYQFRWKGHKAIFIESEGAIAVVDPINSEAAAAFSSEIKRIYPDGNLAAIIYSHSDSDHASGADELLLGMNAANVPIIAHELAVAPIKERALANQPLPTVTFSERMTFELNGRPIELHYLGPSHTDNLAVVFIPDVSVVFAVDFVNHDRVAYREMPAWHLPEYFDSLSNMLNIPFETVVFGHWKNGDRGSIQRQIAYYDDLKAAVRKSIQAGMSEDEMASTIALPQYAHWDHYEDWMPLNARVFYRWLTESEPAP